MFDERVVNFLLDRIEEDEARVARLSGEREWVAGPPASENVVLDTSQQIVLAASGISGAAGPAADFVAEHDPERVCREIEVRRWIIHTYQALKRIATSPGEEGPARASAGAGAGVLMLVMMAMADIYSEHPDYDRNWQTARKLPVETYSQRTS